MGTDILTKWLLDLTQAAYSPFYEIFTFLIQTTVYISVTALLILLFKLIFKNRLKAKWHFLIWSVLLIRLIIPILPPSPVSVFNAIKVDEAVVMESVESYIPEENKTEDIVDDDNPPVALSLQQMAEINNDEYEPEITAVSDYTILVEIVTYVWIGGAVLLLGYFIIVLAVFMHRLKKSRRELDTETLSVFNEYKNRLNIKRKANLYSADTTPMLIGLIKPSVYIPDNLSDEELEATLLHELNHMKHLDILWSAVATVVLCLNWFNPIIWLSFFVFKRDIEVYCDERTLKLAENKQSYARLLLKTATARKERFVLGTTSLQSGKADVKRRIRYMAKFKKPTVAVAVTAVVLILMLLLGCLTNAGAYTDRNTTLTNPANGCKMDIVLDKSFAGNDYNTGDGTSFQFHTDMPIDDIAHQLNADNAGISIIYQDDKQVLFITENRDSFPYLLLTKKVSDKNKEDVKDVVFLEAIGTNDYICAYDKELARSSVDPITYKKYSFYFPEHLRADYRYTNYEDGDYYFKKSNPFREEIKLIGDGYYDTATYDLLCQFYQDIYREVDIQTKMDERGGGQILIEDISGNDLFRVFYDAKKNTVRFKAYSTFGAESAKSVIYRLENAIQRQDKEQMASCFESFDDKDYSRLSKINRDFMIERIYCISLGIYTHNYVFNIHAMIDYTDTDLGSNKYSKNIEIGIIGEDPKITDTDITEFSESDNIYSIPRKPQKKTAFIDEKLGEPDLSELKKAVFSSPPGILYADNSKAIVVGDCGILVYSFKTKKVTLYASYTYLQKLGLSLPYGNASSDGRYVYMNDAMKIWAENERVNKDYLSLVLDTKNSTITESQELGNEFSYANASTDMADTKSIVMLDEKTMKKIGMDNYVGSTYVVFNDEFIYVQLKPDRKAENLSIFRYNYVTDKKEEYKIIPD